jgi:hypothetical protein
MLMVRLLNSEPLVNQVNNKCNNTLLPSAISLILFTFVVRSIYLCAYLVDGDVFLPCTFLFPVTKLPL